MVSFCVSATACCHNRLFGIALTIVLNMLSSYKTQVIIAEQLYCDLPIKY